jgi:hypothetical protein
MTPERLATLQAELRDRLSTTEGRKASRCAVKSVKVAQVRVTVKQALMKARQLKRDKHRWKKNYVALKRDKRKWMSLLREDARALHVANLALHKEVTAAQAILKGARAKHGELTLDAKVALAYAKGFAEGKRFVTEHPEAYVELRLLSLPQGAEGNSDERSI